MTVLPTSVVRWIAFTGGSVPYPATVFSDTLFASSGLLNVLLFSVTRPSLIPKRSLGTLRNLFTFGSSAEEDSGPGSGLGSERRSGSALETMGSRASGGLESGKGTGGSAQFRDAEMFVLRHGVHAAYDGFGAHERPERTSKSVSVGRDSHADAPAGDGHDRDTQTDESEPWVFRPQPRGDRYSGSGDDFK